MVSRFSVIFLAALLGACAARPAPVRPAVSGQSRLGFADRTMTITSQPSGALVYLNDEEVGRTPVTTPFLFYGVYDVRLVREGFQTLSTAARIDAPWYELPGPDLAAALVPTSKELDFRLHYQLYPDAPTDPTGLVDRARQLRATFEEGAQESFGQEQGGDGAQ